MADAIPIFSYETNRILICPPLTEAGIFPAEINILSYLLYMLYYEERPGVPAALEKMRSILLSARLRSAGRFGTRRTADTADAPSPDRRCRLPGTGNDY